MTVMVFPGERIGRSTHWKGEVFWPVGPFTPAGAAAGKIRPHRLYPALVSREGVPGGPELDPAKLAGQDRAPDAGLSGQGGVGPRPGAAEDPSPAGVRRRGPQPDGRSRPGSGRQGL